MTYTKPKTMIDDAGGPTRTGPVAFYLTTKKPGTIATIFRDWSAITTTWGSSSPPKLSNAPIVRCNLVTQHIVEDYPVQCEHVWIAAAWKEVDDAEDA